MYLQTHSELIKARKKEIIEKTTFSNEQLFYMMEVRNRVWNAKTAVIRYLILFIFRYWGSAQE
jgi:hypothetical protein